MRPILLLSLACLVFQFSSNVFHKQHDIHINDILFLFLLSSLTCAKMLITRYAKRLY